MSKLSTENSYYGFLVSFLNYKVWGKMWTSIRDKRPQKSASTNFQWISSKLKKLLLIGVEMKNKRNLTIGLIRYRHLEFLKIWLQFMNRPSWKPLQAYFRTLLPKSKKIKVSHIKKDKNKLGDKKHYLRLFIWNNIFCFFKPNGVVFATRFQMEWSSSPGTIHWKPNDTSL